MNRLLKSQAGMTLIEIMVVVAIIAGITGLIAVNVVGRQDEANKKLTKTQISNILNALDQYKLDNHKYPTTDQGLEALVEKPSSGTIPKNYPEEGYLKGDSVPSDAWGSEFTYSYPGTNGHKIEICSLGPDGEEETGDEICNYETETEEE